MQNKFNTELYFSSHKTFGAQGRNLHLHNVTAGFTDRWVHSYPAYALIWSPWMDSNHQPPRSKQGRLPLTLHGENAIN
jgi:hypothetical protein